MKKHLPNFVTLLNLLSGTIAVIFAVKGQMLWTAVFVFLGIFFDFFDGLLARKLKVNSELGLELDSLADMVTSGVVPGLVLYHLFEISPPLSWDRFQMIPYLGLLVTLASAYRLAKFNISNEQEDGFIGLPTPANALLILSLPLIIHYQGNDLYNSIILNPFFLIVITFLSCILLNAPLRLIALKFKTWDFKSNSSRFLLIVLTLVILVVFKYAGIPLAILTYILLSLVSKP